MAISKDEALTNCLERLKNTNSSIEDCAAQYPQHQDELVEMLGLVSSLNSLDQISPRGRFTENAGKRLVSKLPDRNVYYGQKTRPIRLKRNLNYNFRRGFGRVRIVLLVVMLLSVFTGGTAFAADSAAPGDMLYGLDLTIERIQLDLAPNTQASTRIHIKIAAERLEEAEHKLNEGDVENGYVALVAYEREIVTLTELVGTADGVYQERLTELVDTALSKNQEYLNDLLTKSPDQARDGIQRALEASSKLKNNIFVGSPVDKPTSFTEDNTKDPQFLNLPTSTPEKTANLPTESEASLTPTNLPVFTWIPEVVYKFQSAGYFANLAIDSQDNLHLGFFQDYYDIVWWIHSLNNKWIPPEQVSGGLGRGFHTSMVLDSADRPHFAYHAIDNRKQEPYLYYKYWTGNNWAGIFRNIEYRVLNNDISLALDPNDSPHFFFIEDYGNSLIYSQFRNGKFENQVVGIGNPDCQSLPIIVDQFGNPHLLYQSVDQGLMYATKQADTWNWVVVAPSIGAGQFSDITLDEAGTIHVAYYDSSEGDLWYAYLLGDGFKQQLIDTQGNVGQYSSIVVDSSGYVHISYYDATNKALKYALGHNDQWAVDTVDNYGSVGEYSSIAIDSNDKPFIAYFDQDNEDLKLARAVPLIP
jgi:hypothetical protein